LDHHPGFLEQYKRLQKVPLQQRGWKTLTQGLHDSLVIWLWRNWEWFCEILNKVSLPNHSCDSLGHLAKFTFRWQWTCHSKVRNVKNDFFSIKCFFVTNGRKVTNIWKQRDLSEPWTLYFCQYHFKQNEHNISSELWLFQQHGSVVDETMADGYTPLHVAAREGHVDVCEALLDNKASVSLSTKVSCAWMLLM